MLAPSIKVLNNMILLALIDSPFAFSFYKVHVFFHLPTRLF